MITRDGNASDQCLALTANVLDVHTPHTHSFLLFNLIIMRRIYMELTRHSPVVSLRSFFLAGRNKLENVVLFVGKGKKALSTA